MKKNYKVYGRTFNNLHDATKYHLKIYGASNWQASTVYNFVNNTVNVEKFKPIKKIVNEYLKNCD